jgi:hypothetical protein
MRDKRDTVTMGGQAPDMFQFFAATDVWKKARRIRDRGRKMPLVALSRLSRKYGSVKNRNGI